MLKFCSGIQKLFSTSAVRLKSEFVVSSNPQPQNLVIIHGILGYGKLYKHIASNPATLKHMNGYALDLRNHGNSPWAPSMTVPEMAQDIKHWLDQQHFKAPVTLMGHSMGARILVELTRLYPELQKNVKRLVLVDAASHSYEGFSFVKKSRDYLELLKTLDLSRPREDLEKQIDKISANPVQASSIKLNLDMEKQKFMFNLDAIQDNYMKIVEYNCPHTDWEGEVYVLKALKSNYIDNRSKEQYKRIYKGLKAVWDIDCYHNVHLEKPFDVIRAITMPSSN